VLALIASVLCLALNAFFVAAEFALVKVRNTQLDRAARRGNRRAIAAREVLKRLDRYLSVTQFGITVASLGLGWIGEPAVAHLADWIAVGTTGKPLGNVGHVLVGIGGLTLLTFLHLLLGELVPKFIAIQHAEATALTAAITLQVVNTVFAPLLWVLEKAQRAVLRLIRVDPNAVNERTISEDELIGVLAASSARNERARDKQRLVERILRLAHRPVRQLMVPRVDVVWLPVRSTIEEAVDVLKKHQFSRIPLAEESLDHVVGYLYAKDLLLADQREQPKKLPELARPVLYVPEERDGFSVLKDMQARQTPLAVVVDEYGGTSGIVTLEDIVEEIVGEIRDELDVEPARVVRVGHAEEWDVDARATVDELREAGVPLEDDEAEFGEQVGTLVYTRLGHLPRIGDMVNLAKDVVAEVAATSRRRIDRLRIRVLAASSPARAHQG
jgi:CBS domain containing-hemolysin-like protein